MQIKNDVRPSPIAGQWYTGNPTRLAESVDSYLQEAQLPELTGEVIGVMAPHAGHRYSGPVAGYAFAALRGLQPEVVAVVSPMHYLYMPALLTTAHTAYETPLGVIQVDLAAQLALDDHLEQALGFRMAPVRNDPEHSLEIELPFLQRAIKGEFRLLPVMVRDQSQPVTLALGKALAQTLQGRRALLVASTDLSHKLSGKAAARFDAEMLRRVEAFNPEEVLSAEDEGKGFACGRGAVAAVLWASRDLGADEVRILKYATSGDVTGDYDEVVGYGAAVFLRSKGKQEPGH